MKASWLDRAPLPTGVFRDQRFAYANDALVELVGLPRERLIGAHFLEQVALEDRERIGDRHARRLRGEPVPESYEFTLVRGDGSRRTVEIWIATHESGDVIFQLHDRTDRALRQEKLAGLARLGVAVAAERTVESIFAALARGLTELDAAMVRFAHEPSGGGAARVVAASSPGDRMARFEAALGQPLTACRGVWGPQGQRAWREGSAFFDDVPLAAACFFAGADADRLLPHARAAFFPRGIGLRVDLDGRPAEALLVVAEWLLPEDVPACRLFGAQISAALDAARAIRDVQSRNAALVALNRVAASAAAASALPELFARGTEEIAAVIGCDAAALYLLDDARGEAVLAYSRGADEEIRKAVARVPLHETNLGLVARDGLPRVFRIEDFAPERRALLERLGQQLVISVPLVSRGKVLGVMNAGYRSEHVVEAREIELMQAAGAHFGAAVEADRLIADLRCSYADLARTQAQLVERERLAAIGELSAVVAHEVRNPLGVLFNSLGALRKLLGREPGGAAGTLLAIMEEEAARLNHIVGDLLDFARPTTPALQRELLDQVLDEAVEAALGDAKSRVSVVRELREIPPVPMDARLMRQAIVNIVDNAAQAMPKGGTLTVRLAPDEVGRAKMVRLEIEDTGPGIAPDVEPRIFEPFFTTRASGTGLGLAVVKRIVDGHRGQLRVASVEGRGTTFTIWLPLDDDGPRSGRGSG